MAEREDRSMTASTSRRMSSVSASIGARSTSISAASAMPAMLRLSPWRLSFIEGMREFPLRFGRSVAPPSWAVVPVRDILDVNVGSRPTRTRPCTDESC